MSESNGKQPLTPPELLLHWITERESIRRKKEQGLPKPWSEDATFQRVYFCNVRREDDKVTRFFRGFYSPYYPDENFEYNIVFSRLLNWPGTIERIGYLKTHDPAALVENLEQLAGSGKVWGGAYLITTHGLPMDKATYAAWNVLGATHSLQGPLLAATRRLGGPTCSAAHKALQTIEGLGSFLAAQVVADLKNTSGHPLSEAADWWEFVAHGPGSLRGLQWFWQHERVNITPRNFQAMFIEMRAWVYAMWDMETMGKWICAQDLQNCLCEFDKYMRVRNGTGKSKRNYPGI